MTTTGRDRVRKRSNERCECCLRERATQFHHRWKDGQGGPETASNLLHVGPVCHHEIEHHPSWAKSFGWWLEPWRDPATSECLHSWRGWVYLQDDGDTRRAYTE